MSVGGAASQREADLDRSEIATVTLGAVGQQLVQHELEVPLRQQEVAALGRQGSEGEIAVPRHGACGGPVQGRGEIAATSRVRIGKGHILDRAVDRLELLDLRDDLAGPAALVLAAEARVGDEAGVALDPAETVAASCACNRGADDRGAERRPKAAERAMLSERTSAMRKLLWGLKSCLVSSSVASWKSLVERRVPRRARVA